MAKCATDVDKKHFAVKCQSSSTNRYPKQKVHNVKETQESDSEVEFVMTIAQDKMTPRNAVAPEMANLSNSKLILQLQ